eukprot:g3855.t1
MNLGTASVRTAWHPLGSLRKRTVLTASLKTVSDKIETFVKTNDAFREICEENYSSADINADGKINPREIVRKSAKIFKDLEASLESASIAVVLPETLETRELLRAAKLYDDDHEADLTEFTLFFKQVLKLSHYRADPGPPDQVIEEQPEPEVSSTNGVVETNKGMFAPILAGLIWTFALFALVANLSVPEAVRKILQIGAVAFGIVVAMLAKSKPKDNVDEEEEKPKEKEVEKPKQIVVEDESESDPVKEFFRQEIFNCEVVA